MKKITAIRSFLREHRISQSTLATALGITPSAVSQVLSGKMPLPDLGEWIAALSACVGMAVHVEHEMLAKDGKIQDNIFAISAIEPWPDDDVEE